MENLCSFGEGDDHCFQSSMFREQDLYFSLEYQTEALFYTTAHFYTSTTQSSFWQDEYEDFFHGGNQWLWPELEEGAHHKGVKELKQEVGGDAAVKKLEGSEEVLFPSTQHLCTSTTSADSCLSQAVEGDRHKVGKDLTQELDGDAGEKKRSVPEEKQLLTFEVVSQYYCMPIKQAAEELNVGLTHLKKRCRELGIPRWPHRQLKSLETLIKNVQELRSCAWEQGGTSKSVLDMLHQAKRLIEESPGGVELDRGTKVLRQAFFKESYKRRRLMAIQG